MEEKIIRITCEGAAVFEHEQLFVLQGDLKELTEENYQRLRKEILDLGYAEPIAIWQDRQQKMSGTAVTNWICNGTQRWRALKQMIEVEGYRCPPLPVSITHAESLKEAKLKILALASQYGRVDRQGLYEFIHDMDLSPKELSDSFNFPEISWPAFEAEYFKDPLDVSAQNPGGQVGTATEELEALPPSGVRMVQLFFNEITHPQFLELAQMLGAQFNTTSVTDTVLEAMRAAAVAQGEEAG